MRGFVTYMQSHLGQLFIFPWKKRAVLGVVDLFVVPLPFYVPHSFHMHILGLELGVIGGLITPVCSYILSESIMCHSTWFEVCLVLCCVVL